MYTPEVDKHRNQEFSREAVLPAKIRIRPVEAEDINFVLDSWLRSYRDSMRAVVDADYYAQHQALIAALAARSTLLVACDEDTPGFLLGWACGTLLSDPGALQLHYVYTKQPYRCLHVMRDLLGALGWQPGQRIKATHWNRAAVALSQKFNITYDPYPIMLGAKR